MAENVWSVPVGSNAVFHPYLTNSRGQAITTYTGSEAVRAFVWQGDDTEAIDDVLSLSFDALQAATGKTTAAVDGTATEDLAPGWYLLRCEIELSGAWYTYYEGFLHLKDSPGTAEIPPVYCTVQDMLDQGGGWLPKLMSDLGRTNFIAERARAKSHIDRVILNHVRNNVGEGSNAFVSSDYALPGAGGELPDPYVKGLLSDGDKLLQNDEIKEAAAFYALHLLCMKALTFEAGDVMLARSRYYKAQFNRVILSTVAQFDTNDDGEADLSINLGRFSIR